MIYKTVNPVLLDETALEQVYVCSICL